MNVSQLHCPNCGSQLDISENIEMVTCAYCATQLVVTRSENSVMLQMGETLRDAIADSSSRTEAAIEQGAFVTRDELRRVQQIQQYSNLRLMLANLSAEIRELERDDFSFKRSSDLRQLRAQESMLQSELLELQRVLEPEKFAAQQHQPLRRQSNTNLSAIVKWILFWPFLIAGILWRFGAVGKVGAIIWAFTVWPIYIYIPLAICGLFSGG